MVVYGERPITEFIIGLAQEKELIKWLNEAQFLDKSNLEINEKIQKLYIEAPLGGDVGYIDILFSFESICLLCEVKPQSWKSVQNRLKPQIRRYYNFLDNLNTTSNARLVKRIIEEIKSKERYLICVTDDKKYPKSLERMIYENIWNKSKVGWLSYNFFRKQARKNDFKIKGSRSHIWLERYDV